MRTSITFLLTLVMTIIAQKSDQSCVIASWNILNERFYKRFSAPDFIRMPLEERTLLFENSITSMATSVDIIALQECGSFAFTDSFKQHYTLLSGIHGYLVTACKKSAYIPLQTEAIKSTGSGTGKGFLVTILQTTTMPHTTIGVINVHLPFARESVNHEARLRDLRTIRAYIAQHQAIEHWFVCGDFNIPASRAHEIEGALKATCLQLTTTLKSLAYTMPTAYGHKGLEHIDYIFYTPHTIAAIDYTTIPSAEQASAMLLTQGLSPHVLTDAGRGHSSDHAISILRCTLMRLH